MRRGCSWLCSVMVGSVLQWSDWQWALRVLQVPDPGHLPVPVLPQWLSLHGECVPSHSWGCCQSSSLQPITVPNQPFVSHPLLWQLQHGDWFCGKSVGLLVLKIQEIVFNIYVTHVSLGAGEGRL